MKEEIVSYELILRYTPGSLNPIDINENYLEKVKIIDDSNKIDRGMLRIGSLGTNIILSNETEDEIKIQQSSLTVQSKSFERLDFIVNQIKKSFRVVSIIDAEYSSHTHLIDESYPNSIFDKYTTSESLDLDVIRFKHEKIMLTMHSCNPNTIHLTLYNRKKIGKQFVDLKIDEDLEMKNMNQVFENFKKNDLNI